MRNTVLTLSLSLVAPVHLVIIDHPLPPDLASAHPSPPSFEAMHDVDPVFRAFSRSEKIKDVLVSLGYQRPLPVQSMYIFKVGIPTVV